MNKRSVFSLTLCAYLLAACSTMTPVTYANYADNTMALRKFSGASVVVVSMGDATGFKPECRMAGTIAAAGGRSIPQFVQDSFNDELKFAGVYGDGPDAVRLQATLTGANFSSWSNLTKGWWALSIKITNARNQRTVIADARYDFPSGFDAMTACQATAGALTPAVQRLIHKAVTDPEFARLIGR